ncbi:MAG: hypothetical protein ACTSXU_06595, partial [Promethearchaeota archaeon]
MIFQWHPFEFKRSSGFINLFKIDADYIVVNDFNDFVDYIDKQFDTWSDMEKLKKGKLESSFEGGTNQTAFSTGTTP